MADETASVAATPVAAPEPKKRRKKNGAFLSRLKSAFVPNARIATNLSRTILVGSIVLWLAAWVLLRPASLPTPSGLLDGFADLFTKHEMLKELLTSLMLNAKAIGLATLFSLVLAYATVLAGLRPTVAFITKMRFLSLLGITFIFQFGFGLGGHWLKVWLLTFGMTTFFLTSTAAVVAEIPKEQWEDAATLRMRPWRAALEVAVLGTFDKMLEALRQNAAIAWVMLTTVEGMVRSEGGIGTLILNENKHFRLDSVFAIQITVLLVGLLQDAALGWIRSSFCPWSVNERKG